MLSADVASVQDRDLLARLTTYFQSLEARVQEGQGWLIFNAQRGRTLRITRFVLERLDARRPFLSYYHVPWRDFALNAYMSRVELPSTGFVVPTGRDAEYDIAGRVSRDQYYHMRATDVLLLTGLAPEHRFEVDHLDAVISARFTRRLPILLTTPHPPHDLPRLFAAAGGTDAWTRLYEGMLRTSLIAF
ncbi:MAG: hypothetical protein FJ033_04690 [Chloroflexi bacterium]|nr:hypothetical protein [Chloroflexota bacterium]